MDGDLTVLKWEKKLSFSTLCAEIKTLGKDCVIVLSGGSLPHIGCAVLAVPRPSLLKNGEVSVTSSVLNLPGHKDEFICRKVAEAAAKARNASVLCTGGFHFDEITEEQIGEVLESAEELAEWTWRNAERF